MEKNHDDGIKNINRQGMRRMIDKILSEERTKTIIKQTVREDIENFEETLDINDLETKVQRPN